MSRNNNRRIVSSDEEEYSTSSKSRPTKRISHYSTPKLRHPTVIDRQSFTRATHIWTAGDTLMKLADKHYGDVKLWWVLAWYNTKPTDSHFELGDIVYIPFPLNQVLAVLRSE
jgi:nucleoid-associated protein YgaU